MKRKCSVFFKIIFVGFLILVASFATRAAEAQAIKKTETLEINKDNITQTAPSFIPNPKIVYYFKYEELDPESKKSMTKIIETNKKIRLGSKLTICTDGLQNWIKAGNDPINLRIFMGGYMLSSIEPITISPESQEYVNFLLKFNGNDKEERMVWSNIFEAVRNTKSQKILISLGQKDKRQAFESNVFVTFRLYPWFWPIIVLSLIALLVLILVFAWKTNLLRDTSTIGSRPSIHLPFSLSKVQMAWWFYLILASFVYVWIVTQTPHALTPSVLGLLGISATTGLVAVAVDNKKTSDNIIKRKELEVEIKSLNERIKEIKASPIEIKSFQNSLETQLSKYLADFERLSPDSPAPRSNKFFKDILDGGDGISLHRIQIFVWTFVIGLIFIYAVYKECSMPELDASILALMGVSSGTYVGFKYPEKK